MNDRANKCRAETTQGKLCSRTTFDPDRYCWQHRPLFQRLIRSLRKAGVVTAVLALVGFYADIYGLGWISKSEEPGKMQGDYRVAVVDFTAKDLSISYDLKGYSEGVYLLLQKTLAQNALDFTVTVWGPEETARGINSDGTPYSSDAVHTYANRIGADLIVSGQIIESNGRLQIVPNFFIAHAQSPDTSDIIGQHQFGSPIMLSKNNSIVDRITISREFAARTEMLSNIVIGLAYLSEEQYDSANKSLLLALNPPMQSKHRSAAIVNLLLGNVAIL